MKVEFNGDEVMAIMKKHVMAEHGFSETEIAGAGWEAEKDENGKWVLRVIVGVKLKDPYRE